MSFGSTYIEQQLFSLVSPMRRMYIIQFCNEAEEDSFHFWFFTIFILKPKLPEGIGILTPQMDAGGAGGDNVTAAKRAAQG